MDIQKKSNIIMILLIILIILSIAAIIYIKNSIDIQDELMQCIAENSVLYSAKTCSFCAKQKIILGDGFKYFKTIDCIDNSTECVRAGVLHWPTWEINGKMQPPGVMNIEQLKEVAGC